MTRPHLRLFSVALTLLAVASVATSEPPRTRCWCSPRRTPCGPAVHPAQVAAIRFACVQRERWRRHATVNTRRWSAT